jgi:hypothetical protein
MGSGLTIDNVPGPVFEGKDQQLWISGVGPASCQRWNVRPDPMFSCFRPHILGLDSGVNLVLYLTER